MSANRAHIYEQTCSFCFGIIHLVRLHYFSEKLTFPTCAYQCVRNDSFSENFVNVHDPKAKAAGLFQVCTRTFWYV